MSPPAESRPADRAAPQSDSPNGQVGVVVGTIVTGAVLDDLRAALTRYVAFPSAEAADAVALWIAATYAVSAFQCAPRLNISSPVKRCGKSRLMDIITATCHKPLITVNISPAALVRSITEDDPPTLLLDEADTVFGPKAADHHEDLRGLINAGHTRDRPYLRWDIKAREVEHCPTFAMVALAGIGNLPDTIADRSVIIRMRRRAPSEQVERYRDRRDGQPLRDLGERLGLWVGEHIEDLREAEPSMPVDDRAADTWEPLFAVAELAGGSWPQRCAVAALALTADDDTDTILGVRLLADLRDVFGDRDRMHGETILGALQKIAEGPWSDYFGRPLNARDLARLLGPYGVKSRTVKVDGVAKKGYQREDLHDPWIRYLSSATSVTSVTPQVEDLPWVTGNGQQAFPVTSPKPLTSTVAEVTEVTDTPQLCAGCGQPLDSILVGLGLDTHGGDCDEPPF